MGPALEKLRKRYPVWAAENRGESADHTFALDTSGGLYLKDTQPRFSAAGIDGDPSSAPSLKTMSPRKPAISHPHYAHAPAEEDVSPVFPLEAEGVAGAVAPTPYSPGYVNDVMPLAGKTAPAIPASLRREG